MKYIFSIFFLFSTLFLFAQDESGLVKNDTTRKSLREAPKENPKAAYDQYKIINYNRDTTFVDTTLNIRKEYEFNHLRKDNFGLLAFHNDGHTYNTLDFGLERVTALPQFGFKAKHFNYLEAQDINYYSVATPFSEIYFKTVLEQGQSIDAFITLNTSKRLNFSIAYKGLRSLGKYINALSSAGNFRFTTSYSTLNKRYIANFHFVNQDIFNNENGGIQNNNDFESNDSQFSERARIDVNFQDASSMLKGKRFFIDHSFAINPLKDVNVISIGHEMSYETKFFEFKKSNTSPILGASFLSNSIEDLTKTNSFYNKLSANFSKSIVGNFSVFLENFRYNYFYNRVIIENNQIVIPNTNNNNLNAFGGKYLYSKNKIKGQALFSKSLSKQTFSTLDVSARYEWNKKNIFSAQFTNISKVPDMNYTLYQSDFVNYNWKTNFKNEKINTILVKANTQWGNAEAKFMTLNDHLFFSDDSPSKDTILVTPKQYSKTINYISFKLDKEIKFRKFALDNTILFQSVTQDDNILNVPKIVARNTLYYSDLVFKKAMFLQTGFTFQYFSKYYANEHNPLIAEFYVQNNTKIGDFPLIDFFINARIRQTRIFLKAEHLNSSLTGRNYYASPNQPYKDFLVRFGFVWNFFQ